jgi:hypothetical protein
MVGDNDDKVFGNLNVVINNSFFYPPKDKINSKEDVVFIRDLLQYENTDHDMIKYICSEMKQLLDINKEKYAKINVGFLLATIIDYEFNRYYSYTTIQHNNSIKLSNILSAFSDVQIYEDNDEIVDRLITEQDEETKIDIKEENEALDAQQDAPDEGDDMGDEDVVFMPDY